MTRIMKGRHRLGITLVELMIVIGLGSMVTIAAWRLFDMQNKLYKFANDKFESQRAARRIVENLKNDIREAVWSDMLLGGKFIIQHPVEIEGSGDLGGSSIKFAKFAGLDSDGKPMIEKVMYLWDQEKNKVLRGNWEGPWKKDNSSAILNGREIEEISRKKDGSGKGYLFFREVTYDQDEQFGLVGRTLILVGLRVDYDDEAPVELHTVIGPRYINSRDREPFWNENEISVMDYKMFEE